MTTAGEISTRAMRRLSLISEEETPSGRMQATTLQALNALMHQWAAQGVDVLHSDYVWSDTVCFYVPPRAVLRQATIDAIDYKGLWDASANSPALASGVGTDGHVYKVGTAGTTNLDGVDDWAINQFVTFDGTIWRRSPSWLPHETGLVALLAVDIASEYGRDPPAMVIRQAYAGWLALQGAFVDPRIATFDRALTFMPSARKEWH